MSMQGGTEQVGCMCGGTWWHFCEYVRQLTAGVSVWAGCQGACVQKENSSVRQTRSVGGSEMCSPPALKPMTDSLSSSLAKQVEDFAPGGRGSVRTLYIYRLSW